MRLGDKQKPIQERKKQAYQFFLERGYTPVQSAGIVGNLIAESSLNHQAGKNDKVENSMGLAQWNAKGSPERVEKFQQLYGVPIRQSTFEQQLDYVDWELKNKKALGLEHLQKATTPDEAALVISKYYERPHKDYAHNDRRINNARNLLQTFEGMQFEPQPQQTVPPTQNTDQALTEQKTVQPSIFDENLTFYEEPKINRTFVSLPDIPDDNGQENGKEDEESTAKTALDKKIAERNFLVGLLQQGAFNYVAPEYKRTNAFAQQPSVMQSGGQVDYDYFNDPEQLFVRNKEFQKEIQFYNDYLNSPVYKKRIEGMGWENTEQVIKDRLNNLNTMTIQRGDYGDYGSSYKYRTNKAYVDNGEIKNRNSDKSTIAAHEISHGIGSMEIRGNSKIPNLNLNDNERLNINKRNNASDPHDSMPSELKAEIDALRYKLFEDKIYDTKTQEFNKYFLNKAKSKYKSNKDIKRVFDNVKDDDLIWLMNNIASTEDMDNNNIFIAKDGGKINPWAICTASVGRDDKEKYERCVLEIKKKHGMMQDGGRMDRDEEVEKLKIKVKKEEFPTANTWGNMFGNVGQYFLGIEDKDLIESSYRPTVTTDSDNGNIKYYTRTGMKEDVFRDFISPEVKKAYNHNGTFEDIYKGLKSNGKDREHSAEEAFPKNKAGYKGMYNLGHGSFKGEFNLGRYRVDAGEDEKGRYISFSDVYDWNGMPDKEKAIHYYDRIYEDEWKNFNKRYKKSTK
jgi:hypothetical protein